jgi:hypothetical protein
MVSPALVATATLSVPYAFGVPIMAAFAFALAAPVALLATVQLARNAADFHNGRDAVMVIAPGTGPIDSAVVVVSVNVIVLGDCPSATVFTAAEPQTRYVKGPLVVQPAWFTKGCVLELDIALNATTVPTAPFARIEPAHVTTSVSSSVVATAPIVITSCVPPVALATEPAPGTAVVMG